MSSPVASLSVVASPSDPARRRLFSAAAGLSAAGLVAPLLPVSAFAGGVAVPASGATPDGPLRLDLNESRHGPSPAVAPAIAAAMPRIHQYVSADQLLAFQTLVAQIEGVQPEQVIVGEVLEALGQLLAQESGGGDFIVSVPGYTALADAATAFGGHRVDVPLDADLANDLPAIEAAISERTRAVFLVNPHNPTGTVSAPAHFQAFVRRAAARALVIVDEAYVDYLPEPAAHTTVPLLREGLPVMVFRTLGKIHALAGLQVGYALAPIDVARRLRARGLGGAHAQNQLSLAAASASLRDPAHIEKVSAEVAGERALWVEHLRALGLAHAQPAANFVFFDAGRPHAQVAAALLADGIKVARAFAPYETWVRISIGLPEENRLARAALAKVLAD